MKISRILNPNDISTQKLAVFVLIGLAGSLLLLAAVSAISFSALEAESGNLNGCVAPISDSNASGTGTNRAIQFGTGSGCEQASPPSGENVFTLASIPDTQVESLSSSGMQRFNQRAQWLVNNKTALNLKYIWQVGDLQDNDDETHSQYERITAGLRIFEQAGLSYALTVGNHDSAATCPGGSACPGVDIPSALRNVNTWHQYYPPSRFPGIKTLCSEFTQFNTRLMAAFPSGMASTNHNHPQYVKNRCAERDTTDNAYRTFTAGGLKWLLINYEFHPRQVVQEWMKTVLERHSDHNAILFTHMFIGGSGQIATSFEGYGSPQGAPNVVFDNVIKQYSNVRFTFSGHTGTAACATFTGVNGNSIYSFMDNRREGSPAPNHVRLIEINVSGRTATSRIYAPNLDQNLSQASNCNRTGVTWVQ